MAQTRHITLPQGFLAAGVKCGIKESGREDLAVIVGQQMVSAAVLTTSNQVVGAPVLWCRKVLPAGFGWIRGIVVNSGCSNVCTGRQGERDAAEMAALAGRLVGAEPAEMLVASTGIIGRRLPMAKVRSGIRAAVEALGCRDDPAVVRAIMTTDTRQKSAVARVRMGGETVTVAGIVKGAGMICPSLAGPPPRGGSRLGACATMIAVLTTDAVIAPRPLYAAFKKAAPTSFNAVTIDSDQSTSDTAVVMASGLAGSRIVPGSAAARRFAAALAEVCHSLAVAMARDGEGATKLIQVNVTGAVTSRQAEIVARAVANSPLFKCAVHGGDPNWGRILAAAGKSPAKVRPERLSVRIGGVAVFARGVPKRLNLRRVEQYLAGNSVLVELDLGLGKGRFTAYTCDLSARYVAINAEYHT